MIPGVQTFHTRESWQDPRYPVFGPLDDPSNNRMVVIHYTAADDLIDGDPGEHASDLPAYMRAMQRSYVLNRGYSLGYLFAVDWLGGVWQIRGWEYQSAANKGENATTWPILMLVDGDDPATPEAVRSVQAIVAEAERRAGRPQSIVGHKDIGATACPGAGLYAQVKAGVFTPRPDPIVPPITPGEDPIMFIAKPGPELAQFGDIAWFAVHESGVVRHASGPDAEGTSDHRLIRGNAHWNIYARAANKMAGAGLTLLPE